jgi:hypothetical protein
VNPGQLKAAEGMVLAGKLVHEATHSLIARVDTFGRGISTQDQTNGHDPTGNSPTHAPCACHSTTEAGSNTGDKLGMDIQVLGDRQQNAFSSIEAGGAE